MKKSGSFAAMAGLFCLIGLAGCSAPNKHDDMLDCDKQKQMCEQLCERDGDNASQVKQCQQQCVVEQNTCAADSTTEDKVHIFYEF
ncbi:hypothetical protein ACSLBF_13055 [Pseudoalteromonas sp. T1lg65]|uniref:hypothetical protein n=1 Tax=Pseudoalteromonas sp. T1lg65 TaxID=2077101 RepID=UPI003F7AC61E